MYFLRPAGIPCEVWQYFVHIGLFCNVWQAYQHQSGGNSQCPLYHINLCLLCNATVLKTRKQSTGPHVNFCAMQPRKTRFQNQSETNLPVHSPFVHKNSKMHSPHCHCHCHCNHSHNHQSAPVSSKWEY